MVLDVALKLEDNSSVVRLGGAVDEYSILRRPRNAETNVSSHARNGRSGAASRFFVVLFS